MSFSCISARTFRSALVYSGLTAAFLLSGCGPVSDDNSAITSRDLQRGKLAVESEERNLSKSECAFGNSTQCGKSDNSERVKRYDGQSDNQTVVVKPPAPPSNPEPPKDDNTSDPRPPSQDGTGKKDGSKDDTPGTLPDEEQLRKEEEQRKRDEEQRRKDEEQQKRDEEQQKKDEEERRKAEEENKRLNDPIANYRTASIDKLMDALSVEEDERGSDEKILIPYYFDEVEDVHFKFFSGANRSTGITVTVNRKKNDTRVTAQILGDINAKGDFECKKVAKIVDTLKPNESIVADCESYASKLGAIVSAGCRDKVSECNTLIAKIEEYGANERGAHAMTFVIYDKRLVTLSSDNITAIQKAASDSPTVNGWHKVINASESGKDNDIIVRSTFETVLALHEMKPHFFLTTYIWPMNASGGAPDIDSNPAANVAAISGDLPSYGIPLTQPIPQSLNFNYYRGLDLTSSTAKDLTNGDGKTTGIGLFPLTGFDDRTKAATFQLQIRVHDGNVVKVNLHAEPIAVTPVNDASESGAGNVDAAVKPSSAATDVK